MVLTVFLRHVTALSATKIKGVRNRFPFWRDGENPRRAIGVSSFFEEK